LIAWLQRVRWLGFWGSLALSLLCLLAGVGLSMLVFTGFWAVTLLFIPKWMGGPHPLLFVPLGLTLILSALLLVDALRSRRDDISNPLLWLLREVTGLTPRLFLESVRCLKLAAAYRRFDPVLMADVLFWLCARRKSAPWPELKRTFPDCADDALRIQLGLVEGVLFLNADFSRVTLSQPLRVWISRLLAKDWRPVEAEAEATPPPPPPVVEPEPLAPHEILGVTATATLAEIKAAYRQRIKECHPDRFAHLDAYAREQAEEWTKILNGAYATLCAEKGSQRGRT